MNSDIQNNQTKQNLSKKPKNIFTLTLLAASRLNCFLKSVIAVSNFRPFLLLLCLLMSCFFSAQSYAGRSFYMGFTPWPYDVTWNAVVDTYNFLNKNADIISQHIEEGVPWDEALADTAFPADMMNTWNIKRRLTSSNNVFLSISPLNQSRNGLALNRSATVQSPLPPDFVGVRFNDPIVKEAYFNYAKRAIDYFKPKYVAIGIEVNELLDNSPYDWDDFTDLYKTTYADLKALYPDLPIFFTVSLHNVVNKSLGEPRIKWSELQELWNYSDLIGISYYPYLQYPFDPANPLLNNLSTIKQYSSKPIAITEGGYPAEVSIVPEIASIPATPQIQKNIYSALFNTAKKENYVFVILWNYMDYDKLWEKSKGQMPQWGAMWKDNGILDGNGRARPSKNVWDVFFALPKL